MPIEIYPLITKIMESNMDETQRVAQSVIEGNYRVGYYDGFTAGEEYGYIRSQNAFRRLLGLELLELPSREVPNKGERDGAQ